MVQHISPVPSVLLNEDSLAEASLAVLVPPALAHMMLSIVRLDGFWWMVDRG